MIYIYLLLAVAVVWGGFLYFLRRVWFYRDPVRTPETDEPGAIVSPADGRVVYVKKVCEDCMFATKLGEKIPLPEITGTDDLPKDGWAIGIYMSPLDVHFNYAPHPAKTEAIHYKEAKANLPMLDLWEYIKMVWLRKMVDMFAKRYHLENERMTMCFDTGSVKMAVVLIADKFVSKITKYVSTGDDVAYSQKLAFIERGSQADLIIFSDDVDIDVSVGDQVYGGRTILGHVISKVKTEEPEKVRAAT